MGKNYKKTSISAVRFSNAKGKEYWRQQVKYSSLAFFELSEGDRTYALEKVLPLTTGKKAQDFVRREHNRTGGDNVCHWAVSVLDSLGDVHIIRYRGVAIRLLYKRTVMEHPITEMCPVPDKPVIDPEDAWIYLDLVGSSARQTHAPTLARLEELEQELVEVREHVKAQDNLIIETEREAYNRAVEDTRKENADVSARLEKVEAKQLKIPLWAMRYVNLAKRGTTVQENPALYNVAMQVCHEFGMDWTDPRNGKTFKAPKGGSSDENSDRKSRQRKTKSLAKDGAHSAQRHGKAVRRPSKGK